jgi:predicted site-specific integrase-resolvase
MKLKNAPKTDKELIAELKRQNRNLSNTVKRQKWWIGEMGKINEIQKEIIKENRIKVDKEKIKEKTQKFGVEFDKTKVSSFLGFCRQSMYGSNYVKKEKETDEFVEDVVKILHKESHCNYGRPKLSFVTNLALDPFGYNPLSD